MDGATGRRWEVAPPAPAAFREALPDVHPVVRQVLYNRGLTTAGEARAFLAGEGAPLHDPRLLSGMDRATGRLRLALERAETVVVHGDFDVDGVTATAILVEGLRAAAGGEGAGQSRIVPHLPQRTVTGYGLQAE